VPLLGESTRLLRNGNARPVPGILGATLLKVYALVGEEIAAPDLCKSSDMDEAALGAALAELVERGLVIAELEKSKDPLDLDFTSSEVLDQLRVEAGQVKQAEEEARRQVEAEREAKLQAEAKVRSEAEAKARADADAKANAAALARLKAEKVARTQSDSEINARQGALDRAENEARTRADTLARAEAEARARADSVRKAEAEAALRLAAVRRMEIQLKGKMAALARLDAERQRKAAADAKAREEAAALASAQAENERRAREEAESRAASERRSREAADARAEQERQAREAADARAEQERRAREEADARAAQEQAARETATEAARQDALALAETEHKARLAAEARAEQERVARKAAEEAARQEALAIADKERRARVEVEARAQAERRAAEQAAAAARAEATAIAEEERRAREAAEQRAEAERQLREQAEANAAAQIKAKASAEEHARRDALALAREVQATQERLRAEASERALAEQAAREEAQAERRAREQAEAMVAAERSAREEVERRAREQADAERRAREQAQALAEAERKLREEAEARMRALSSTEREAREKTEAQLRAQIDALTTAEKQARTEAQAAGDARRAAEARAAAESQPQPLAGLQPTVRPTAPAAPAAAQPLAAEPSLLVDAEVLARAARQAIEDTEAQSRLEQERFTRELEEQMARVSAEQAPVPASPATGKPLTLDEEIKAIRENEARERAEAFARQQMADILQVEEKRAREEEQRRLLGEEEAKRRAREAAEIASRARAEREKFERERERQRKLAEAEEQALARAKARAEQPPESRWKLYTGGAVLLVAVIIGLFEVLPFNFYLSRVEQAMSNALGERVVVRSMHASLIPRPNIRLTEVTIGASGSGATVAAVHAVPTVLSLFWGPLTFQSVQLETVTVAQEFIPKLPDVIGMGGKQTLGFERISIRNLRLALPNLELPPAEVEIAWNSDGTFNQANILTYSRRVAIDLTRAGDEVAFRMSATNWQPLPGSTATIDQMKANGTATRNGLVASEVDADLYTGKAQGSFTVVWGPDAPNATASGEFLLRRLDVAKFLPAMTANASATGLMDGNMKFSLQAPTLRRLLDAPQVSTSFTIRRGWLGGIDMVRLLRDSTNRGGRTVFEEWTGVFAVAGSNYSLRQMRLTSGPMTAAGVVDIDADSVLTGRINAQLSTGDGTAVRSSFGLGGTLQNIEVGN